MSVFVDPQALIKIKVRYIEVRNSDAQVINIKILKNEAPLQEGECEINCLAKGRDYETMSQILEETTHINHISSQPVIRTKDFRYLIIEKFFIQWDLCDSCGNICPINRQSLSRLFYILVKKLANEWLRLTS